MPRELSRPLLLQSAVWRDRYGTICSISAMESVYLRAVLDFLLSHPEFFIQQARRELRAQEEESVLSPTPFEAKLLRSPLEASGSQLQSLMREAPVYRALQAELKSRQGGKRAGGFRELPR